MGSEAPQLGGYQIKNPPRPMDVEWEVVEQVNNLADGGIKQRILGYRLKANLRWGQGWIRDSGDLTGLTNVANDTSATISFVPRPITKPTLSYEVTWLKKFDFVHHKGHFGTYGGMIRLQSLTVTSTVGELP